MTTMRVITKRDSCDAAENDAKDGEQKKTVDSSLQTAIETTTTTARTRLMLAEQERCERVRAHFVTCGCTG